MEIDDYLNNYFDVYYEDNGYRTNTKPIDTSKVRIKADLRGTTVVL